MNDVTRYINFTYVSFEITAEDEALRYMIGRIFKVTKTPTTDRRHVVSVISDKSGLIINLDKVEYCRCEDRESAIFRITEIFGEAICMENDKDVFIMHAANVTIDGQLITLAGTSGSGKTTLSLLLSEYGKYIGDEYAYFDSQTAAMWHDEHPVQIKEHNETIIGLGSYDLIAGISNEFGKVFYIPLDNVRHMPVTPEDAVIPSYIVFPHFKSEYTETEIRKIEPEYFPTLILQSLMGAYPPAIVLKRFMHIAAKEDLRFLEIDFSDGKAAAKALDAYVRERTEK